MRRFYIAATSLLLVTSLLLSGFIAPKKIKALHPAFADRLAYADLDDQAIPVSELSDLDVQPGSVLRLYLVGENGESLFLDQNDDPFPTADVSMSRLRAASVEITLSAPEQVQSVIVVADLASAARHSELSSTVPYIELQFYSVGVLVQDQPFTLEIGLEMAGKQQEQSRIQIDGYMRVAERYLYAEDTAVDLRQGQVVYAQENIAEIAVRLSDTVVLYSSMESGGRYSADIQALMEWGDVPVENIVLAYRLETIQFQAETSTVKIDSNQKLYVYDEQGTCLGTTGSRLAYADTYYLSSKRPV